MYHVVKILPDNHTKENKTDARSLAPASDGSVYEV